MDFVDVRKRTEAFNSAPEVGMSIKRVVDLEFNLSVREIASEFCNLDADEQAKFFNQVYFNSQKWKHPLSLQLQYVSESKNLSDGGRSVMSLIGEYAK